jgi:hypothetical protein
LGPAICQSKQLLKTFGINSEAAAGLRLKRAPQNRTSRDSLPAAQRARNASPLTPAPDRPITPTGTRRSQCKWVYYDAKGKRVPEKDAVFKGKEMNVDSGVPASPGFGSPASTEYHDVHPVGQTELRKTFKSFIEMQTWFNDHGSKAKGKVR